MAKPTSITTWATDAGATADPGATRRATGFIAGKKLPAKWLNWLLNQNAAWLTYLSNLDTEPEFLNKVYKWTGRHWQYVSAGVFWKLQNDGSSYFCDSAGAQVTVHRSAQLSLFSSSGLFGPSVDGFLTAVAGATSPIRQFFAVEVPPTTVINGGLATIRCGSASSIDIKMTFQECGGVGGTDIISTYSETTTGTADFTASFTLPTPITTVGDRRYQLIIESLTTTASYTQSIVNVVIDFNDPGRALLSRGA